MMANEEFECGICQCHTFEGEEMEMYYGYSICILCAIALGL